MRGRHDRGRWRTRGCVDGGCRSAWCGGAETSALIQPVVDLVPVCEHRPLLRVGQPVNGQPVFLFPALSGRHSSAQIGGDLLPRIKAIGRRPGGRTGWFGQVLRHEQRDLARDGPRNQGQKSAPQWLSVRQPGLFRPPDVVAMKLSGPSWRPVHGAMSVQVTFGLRRHTVAALPLVAQSIFKVAAGVRLPAGRGTSVGPDAFMSPI